MMIEVPAHIKNKIRNMPNEEFKKANPFEKRCCADCAFLKAAMSYWCTNSEAIKYRGTSIPGIIFCGFWEPDWNQIRPEFKKGEYGYIKPITVWQKIKNFFK